MSWQVTFSDDAAVLHVEMSPPATPAAPNAPAFDNINSRFHPAPILPRYDVGHGGGGHGDGGGESLFRRRYNSVEEALANTPYAFGAPHPDDNDLHDDRYFSAAGRAILRAEDSLFGPSIDLHITSESPDEPPAFCVTQLIHAQDRYFDLSQRGGGSAPTSGRATHDQPEHESLDPKCREDPGTTKLREDPRTSQSREGSSRVSKHVAAGVLRNTTVPRREEESSSRVPKHKEDIGRVPNQREDFSRVPKRDEDAFRVLPTVRATVQLPPDSSIVVTNTPRRRRETSFAILSERSSRPTSPASLPPVIGASQPRASPFRGRGFREETSRHSTPRNTPRASRASSPRSVRRTSSLPRLNMAAVVAPPPAPHTRPHSPRDYIRENIMEVHELSELNREAHEAESERMRREEEDAILREMGLADDAAEVNAMHSRSDSLDKITIRSRSNSPSAILRVEAVEPIQPARKTPATHTSRLRSVSNQNSPKHSKIPQRQNSVSPTRTNRRAGNELKTDQKLKWNSTSSIAVARRIEVANKTMSKSTQNLNITPRSLRAKPPISPGRGPPPTNRAVNAKRLSPIVGTPDKSPSKEMLSKPASARTSPRQTLPRRPMKTAGNTPAASTMASRAASRAASRDHSPDKNKTITASKNLRSVERSDSNKFTTLRRTPSKPNVSKSSNPEAKRPEVKANKPEVKTLKPDLKRSASRAKNVRNLSRTSSTKTLIDTQDDDKKTTVKKGTDGKSNIEGSVKKEKEPNDVKPSTSNVITSKDASSGKTESNPDTADSSKQDSETQYEGTMEGSNGGSSDLVPLTKMSVVSMTTAAITSQPLDVVTKVTNQLPAALERAREKGVFERTGSTDSVVGRHDHTLEKKSSRTSLGSVKELDVKLKPLQPPFNNPQVARVKQKIDDILNSPEVSPESILDATKKDPKPSTSQHVKEKKLEEDNNAKAKDPPPIVKDVVLKQPVEDIRKEATKIVDSIMTPVKQPVVEKVEEAKKAVEPVVVVVREKPKPDDVKTQEDKKPGQLVPPTRQKSEAQRSNPFDDKSDSDQSNGGVAQSTPPVPPRAHKSSPARSQESKPPVEHREEQKQNFCSRLMSKCAARCTCCRKKQDQMKVESEVKKIRDTLRESSEKKPGALSRLNCCKKKNDLEEKTEIGAGKASTKTLETQRSGWRRLVCCCGRQRVADSSPALPRPDPPAQRRRCCPLACCAGRPDPAQRRDSILSESPQPTCGGRAGRWVRGLFGKKPPPSRRPSMFSKNKSLSPTLPTEDTRSKLDTTLVEHTSAMRGAIPVLPISLAYFCLVCNVIVPGLGTVFSGMLCLCFGIPRFGIHDGLKPRIGSLVINILVGAAQLFTVLFCLVGWGWSIWWGTIMIKVSRRYRKLREAVAEDTEAGVGGAAPITAINHTAAAT